MSKIFTEKKLKIIPQKGFTLLELLVVVAIIGFLVSIVMPALDDARKKARDTVRISDMTQVQTALQLYYNTYGRYPLNTDNDCGGFDIGFNGGIGSGDPFIQPLQTEGFIVTPGDSVSVTNCGGYSYYRYIAPYAGCTQSNFFILGVRNMETSVGPHPASPGWSCPGRDWQNEFEWVTGGFE